MGVESGEAGGTEEAASAGRVVFCDCPASGDPRQRQKRGALAASRTFAFPSQVCGVMKLKLYLEPPSQSEVPGSGLHIELGRLRLAGDRVPADRFGSVCLSVPHRMASRPSPVVGPLSVLRGPGLAASLDTGSPSLLLEPGARGWGASRFSFSPCLWTPLLALLFQFPHVLDLPGLSALGLFFLRSPSQGTPCGLTAWKATPALTTPECVPEAPPEP